MMIGVLIAIGAAFVGVAAAGMLWGLLAGIVVFVLWLGGHGGGDGGGGADGGSGGDGGH